MLSVCTLDSEPHDQRDKVSLLVEGWHVLFQASPHTSGLCEFKSLCEVNASDEQHSHYLLSCLLISSPDCLVIASVNSLDSARVFVSSL